MTRAVVLSFSSAILCTAVVLLVLGVTDAQVMQSGNYQIQSDSINIGGNDLASSSSYWVRSTLGETGTGESSSETYAVGAGYRQMQEIYIALSGATDVTLSPEIPGVTGGSSNGSTTVTVITDNPAGYALTIVAENDPAMQLGANTIADHTPGSNPSYNFDQVAGQAYFGFSPEGADIVARFKDNGAACGTGGSLDTSLKCWDGLDTTGKTIASGANPNHPDGATTTIRFRVNVGAQVNPVPGFYVATTTVTALPL